MLKIRAPSWLPKQIGIPVVAASIAVAFSEGCDQVGVGEYMKRAGYDWIHSIASSSREEPPLVRIVDISPLRPESEGEEDPITPRRELLSLIDEVLAHSPAAVAVDIDFSTDGTTDWVDAEYDPWFFTECLSRSRGAKPGAPTTNNASILLGVQRGLVRGRNGWLTEARFGELAALIAVPRASSTREGFRFATFDGDTLWSVASRLVEASGRQRARRPYPPVLTERYRFETDTSGLGVSSFRVDYGYVDQLREKTIDLQGTRGDHHLPTALAQDAFQNCLVILGDANPEVRSDVFSLPGRETRTPGVYVHASAVYTELRRPIIRLTWIGEFLANFAIAFLAFMLSSFTTKRFNRDQDPKTTEGLSWATTTLAALAAFLVGAVCARFTGLYWDSFLFAFLAYPAVELTWLTTGDPPSGDDAAKDHELLLKTAPIETDPKEDEVSIDHELPRETPPIETDPKEDEVSIDQELPRETAPIETDPKESEGTGDNPPSA